MQSDKAWNPYLAGALSGIVLILSVLIAGKFFGASTSFVRTAGIIESIFASERVSQMDYFIRVAPKIEWQWMFVVGIMLGSLIAAKTSATFKKQWVPDMWQEKFGPNPVKRAVTAVFGGIILMFGARLAGG